LICCFFEKIPTVFSLLERFGCGYAALCSRAYALPAQHTAGRLRLPAVNKMLAAEFHRNPVSAFVILASALLLPAPPLLLLSPPVLLVLLSGFFEHVIHRHV